jgi:spore germination cell wall hydrolase CwlJ-like protein
MKKVWTGFLLAFLLGLGFWSVSIRADEVQQRESEVQEIEENIKKEEERQKRAEENAAWVRYLRNKLQEELDVAQAELNVILDDLTELNRQAEDADASVNYYLEQRVESEERLAEQKAAMALRIQYSYEQPATSYWDLLFGAKSLGEILSKAEYISSMSSYDKAMMEEYEATLAECSENLDLMVAEQARLVDLLAQSEEKEAEYTAKTEEMLAKIAQYNASAAEYTEQAEAYAAEVAEQQEKLVVAQEAARRAAEEAARRKAEEEAARKRAEEEAARQRAEAAAKAAAEEAARRAAEEAARKKAEEEAAAAAARAEQERIQREREELLARTAEEKRAAQEAALIASDRRAVGSIIIDPDLINPSGYTNLQLLAAIIDCEAGGQTYEGKVAVGNVIMNRILDPRFQTTIYDVVYGPGQFSPVKNGFLARKLAQGATEACYEAARDVLAGVWVIPKEYLYFCTPEVFAKRPPKRYTSAITVCWHVFYY